MFLHEEQITCPYCWESITLLVDPSESQTYTEDCFVCCRPILVNTDIQGDSITVNVCLLYTSPSPRDRSLSRMPSSA